MRNNRRIIQKSPAATTRTPRQIRSPVLNDKDVLFCHLIVLLGYPQSDSFRVAYGSTARSSSLAAMACRRLQDPEIAEYCHLLRTYFGNNQLEPR